MFESNFYISQDKKAQYSENVYFPSSSVLESIKKYVILMNYKKHSNMTVVMTQK